MAGGRPNEGIFTVLEGIVAGIGEKVGKGISAIGDAFGQDGASASASQGHSEGMMARMMDAMGFGDKAAPEIQQARVQQPEIQVASAATNKENTHDFHASELGNLAPPPLPMNVSRGAGIGV